MGWNKLKELIVVNAKAVNTTAGRKNIRQNTKIYEALDALISQAFAAGHTVVTYTIQENCTCPIRIKSVYFDAEEISFS